MRRFLLVLVGLGIAPAVLPAQDRPESRSVAIAMGLDGKVQANGAQMPIVYLRNLIADERWYQALDNSLPIVVTYTLQTWRSRDGWIDELSAETGWQTIVTKEPLQEEYTITIVTGGRFRRPERFAVRDSALQYLNLPQRIQIFPQRPGRFYYTVSARITALSDRNMEQLERFLAGDPDLDDTSPGSPIGAWFRRFLLRIAGLPNQVLEARSEQFTVRPSDEEDDAW